VDCTANQTDPYKVGLNDIISCVAMGVSNVRVVDTYPAFLNKGAALTHITEGDIHPNNAGHAQMAHVYEVVYSGR
jgi:hypothetical protein